MSIIGIGTDIVEIKRIENAMTEGFLKRWFTPAENELFEASSIKPATVAGNFAAKEALVKAVGTGFNGISPIEIEILRNENGAPYINLHGNAKKIAERLNVAKIHVSVSHERSAAIAYVVLES